ncbi:hypothetical protein AVEN_212409-1 [Araneus ventricosus]|uniref:DNA-directed RNA polymerase n=1 Tax=Araneus ventricosus TaxID=182803 RepID=A0A4Y2VS74_ARAVE|nr:hypothetical protein AVEN_212409-1 [Araneus ventricosus]
MPLDWKDSEPLKNESMHFEPHTPRLLNVPEITRHIFENYNSHVQSFIYFLKKHLSCTLVYLGPDDIRDHILERTVYACSVRCSNHKILRNVFPVMLGSALDFAIRHDGIRSFESELVDLPRPFDTLDIGRGYFIIKGFLRHLPYLYTNDPTNTHVVQKKMVRVYAYDNQDRGKELSYYLSDYGKRQRGDLVIAHNDGSESISNYDTFFEFCPYPVQQETYMTHLYRQDNFDIDHFGNKMIVSPGHMFVKLFIKYLYGPLREGDWPLIKSKVSLVVKSIETGTLLHVLSRKTLYFKEGKSGGKMTSVQHESNREIGANGEIFIEKNVGCYREVNSQTYPLNPYLLHLIVRQTSQKVKHSRLPAFHSSHIGFLCLMGSYETKNVGRTTMMVRETHVSTCYDLDPVFHDARQHPIWSVLNLEIDTSGVARYFVIVNEACIPVTQASFDHIDLFRLKLQFRHIECWTDGPNFIRIRFKIGIMFKKLTHDVYVTPFDEMYWAERILNISTKSALVDHFGYDYVTSFMSDLNPYFPHNSFPKNIYGRLTMKNAVLAVGEKCAVYFLDSISAYIKTLTPKHVPVLEAVPDGISPHFIFYAVQVTVAYMSHMGCTQEDCIIRHKPVNSFDCCRFYTIRCRVEADGPCVFYPVQGECESEGLGTLINRGEKELVVDPLSIHVKVTNKSSREAFLHFTKTPYRVLTYSLKGDMLNVCVEHYHESSTGDKLCSLHGQKGVVRVMDKVPLLDEQVYPDLIVGPYGIFRMTMGQILEAIVRGGGKDAKIVRNTDGEKLYIKVFYGKVLYIVLAIFPEERIYAPMKCNKDIAMYQPVKGRSRNGGMRLGGMEADNGIRGNGIIQILIEKFFEHSDLRPVDLENNPTIALPQSMQLVKEDSRFFKCYLKFEMEPSIVLSKLFKRAKLSD